MGSIHKDRRNGCCVWYDDQDPRKTIEARLTLKKAAVGGTYEFTRFASANLRERDDSLNTAIGGFLAGSVLGLKCELPLPQHS